MTKLQFLKRTHLFNFERIQMNTSLKSLLLVATLSSLAACGGGAKNAAPVAAAPAATAAATLAPSPTAAPTAVLAQTQTEANTLGAEVKAGLAGAQTAAGNASLPAGVETTALPVAVAMDMSAQMCSSGTMSYDTNIMGTIAAGSKVTTTYGKCVVKAFAGTTAAGATYDGSTTMEYTRYVGPTDYTFKTTYSNFSITGGGFNMINVNSIQVCDRAPAAVSCYYSDGKRGWSTGVTYSAANGATGTYSASYAGGIAKVVLVNFGKVGGTATITGAAGNSATITYTSATSYSVSITSGGVTTTYTVAV